MTYYYMEEFNIDRLNTLEYLCFRFITKSGAGIGTKSLSSALKR